MPSAPRAVKRGATDGPYGGPAVPWGNSAVHPNAPCAPLVGVLGCARLDGRRALGQEKRDEQGQTAVEYLLTTLSLMVVFVSLYGFLQGQLKTLFIKAGMAILTAYY